MAALNYLLGIVLAAYVSITVHELGHVVAGFAARFSLRQFVIVPFSLTWDGGHVQIGLSSRFPRYLGATIMLPKDQDGVVRRTATMIAGGPIASIGLFWVALLTGRLTGPNPATFFLNNTILITAVLAFFSLLPTTSNAALSDGAQLMRLLADGPKAERWCALRNIGLAILVGTRPRDWPHDWIYTATALDDKSWDNAKGSQFAWYSALDAGDTRQAAYFLDRAMAVRHFISHDLRASLLADAAYFEFRWRNDPAASEALIGELGERLKWVPPVPRLRVSVVTLMLAGLQEDARQTAIMTLNALQQATDGLSQVERTFFEDLLTRLP